MKSLVLEHAINGHLKPVKDSDGIISALEISSDKVKVSDFEVTGSIVGISTTDDTKLPLAGGTMSGNIALDGNYVSGDGGNEGLAVDSSGNVGIGTDSPDAKLHIYTADSGVTVNANADELFVENSANAGITIGSSTSGTGNIFFGDSGNAQVGRIVYDHGDDAMYFLTTGATRFVLDINSRMSLSNNDSGTSNTVFGKDAGKSLDAGSNYNVFIGENVSDATMNDATTNVGVGYSALSCLTTGDDNTCIGASAGKNIDTGARNVVIGNNACDGLDAENENVVIGDSALGNSSAAVNNAVIIGYGAAGGGAITTAANGTVAIGNAALNALTSGSGNVAIGYLAGDAITTGGSNTLIGNQVLGDATTAVNNVAIGQTAMFEVPAGQAVDGCVAIGNQAIRGAAGTTIGINGTVAIGVQALTDLTTGAGNVAVGYNAGLVLTTGDKNTLVGYQAGDAIIDGNYNTAIGYGAGTGITTGSYNTALGYLAGDVVTDGASNTLIGAHAGGGLTEGDHNTFVGVFAGGTSQDVNYTVVIGRDSASGGNMTSGANGTIAIGYTALNALTSGAVNTAIGYLALTALTTGSDNVSIGAYSCDIMSDNSYNTAVGNYTLSAADSGEAYNVALGYNSMGSVNAPAADRNIAIGFEALLGGTSTGLRNVAIGHTSMNNASNAADRCVVVGNEAGQGAMTADGTVAIGNAALNALTSGSSNLAIGYQALKTETTGTNSTAVGYGALQDQNGGSSNAAFGYRAGYEITSAQNNTYIGSDAGRETLAGSNNVAIGTLSLVSNAGGSSNIAIGSYALSLLNHTDTNGTVAIGKQSGEVLTTGAGNLAIGYQSLKVHTTGARNMAIGYQAMVDTDAGTNSLGSVDNVFIGYGSGSGRWTDTASNNNVAVGNNTMDAILDGADLNTAIGYDALTGLTQGDSNTMCGYQAGDGVTRGSQNTGIGAAVAFSISANNQTCVGYQATTDSANDIAIGNTSVDEIEGQVSFGTYSDKRIKRDIKDGDLGLDFIKLLKPRKFKKVSPAKYPDSIKQENDGKNAIWTDAQANKVWDGLIAQEVKEALDKCNTSFSGWREKKNSKQVLEYESLVVPLIKAVQELSSQVEELKSKAVWS